MLNEWLSVKDAAAALGMNQTTVYRLCAAKKIRHRKIGAGGGRIVFTRADLDLYVEACVVEVASKPEPDDQPEGFVGPTVLKHLRGQGEPRVGSPGRRPR